MKCFRYKLDFVPFSIFIYWKMYPAICVVLCALCQLFHVMTNIGIITLWGAPFVLIISKQRFHWSKLTKESIHDKYSPTHSKSLSLDFLHKWVYQYLITWHDMITMPMRKIGKLFILHMTSRYLWHEICIEFW